jgi:threonine/homoserine/homoserine lactone efflux protein
MGVVDVIGVAVSPVPIAAVIVMLFTPKARTNAPAFLIGWILVIVVVGSIVILIPGMEASESEPSTQAGIIKGILGLALLFAGWSLWRKRPQSGDTAEAPSGWTASIRSESGSPSAWGSYCWQ